MSKFFVNKSSRLTVDVHVWENDGDLEATHDTTQLPEEGVETEKVTFIFRKPNYADSTDIIQQSQVRPAEGTIDVTAFQNSILRSLLVDWTLTDGNDKVAVTPANINNLEPILARSAIEGILQKIKL